jgi:prepilin-type processing-associated H-X9-DG protein
MHTVLSKGRVVGFTLTELLVIIGVVAVIAALLLPVLAHVRAKSRRIGCVSRLKNIGLGFRIFATDHRGQFPMLAKTNEITLLQFGNDGAPVRYLVALSNELNTPTILVCPADKKRKVATSFRAVQQGNISYFVGLDTTELQPDALLVGDRNLTTNGRPVKPGLVELTTNLDVGWTSEMHNLQGNVAMGDGSVQQFSGPRLTQALRGTGQTTNRLAVP